MAQFNFFDRSRAKSAVHHKSELTGNGYIGRDLAKSEQIDVLLSMQSGAKLLKLCSRRTRSHWRKFQLDSSNCSINWVSDKKNVDDTTIQITNIIEIICFNKNVVEKFKDTLPETYNHNNHNIASDELQYQQFTIKYIESNKHIGHYIPQLSPNHSLTGINSSNNNNNIITPNHQYKNSSSFIRSLKLSNNNNNNNDESVVTNSNSNHSRNRSGSFIAKFKNKIIKDYEDDNKDNHQQHHQQSQHNKQNSSISTISGSGYHVQELHLMAENAKQANIWIYGLECLIEAAKKNVDLINLCEIPFEYSKFRISYSKLYEYIFEKGNKKNKNINNNDDSIMSQFKLRLDRINTLLYSVVDQLPQSQQLLLEDRKIKIFETESRQINYLMKKIRKDQNDLDDILYQVTKARFSKNNLKEWSYTLTRIEINIGGYQIAINNQKLNNNNIKYHHKRERSKSSSIYSINGYQQNHPFQHSPFIPPSLQQQQYSNQRIRRSSREHSQKHKSNNNNSNILKDRSPRSPFSMDNKFSPSSDHDHHGHQILRPPNSPQGMEKYDSI